MSKSDMPKSKQPVKLTKQQVREGLEKLEKDLISMGGRIVPHPGGTKVRIYPTPRTDKK